MPRVAVVETDTNKVVNMIEVPGDWIQLALVVLPDDWPPLEGHIYVPQIEQYHISPLGTEYVTYHGQIGDVYSGGEFTTSPPEPPTRLEELQVQLASDIITLSGIKEMFRLERHLG